MARSFANGEEHVERIVGRRTLPSSGLASASRGRADAVAWRRSFGGVRVPRGVHRFATHEEADRWLWRMIARPID